MLNVFELTPKERVKKARIRLLREKPFFGYALMHIHLVSKDDPKPRGPKIVYSEKFVEQLDDDELMGVLCHELLHYLLGHTKRARAVRKKVGAEKDRQYYRRMNIAEDIVVNAILVKNGFKLPVREAAVGNSKMKIRTGGTVPSVDPRAGRMFLQLVDAEGKVYEIWDPDKKSAEEVYWEIRDFAVPEADGDDDTMYFSDDEEDESGEGKGSAEESCRSRGKSPEELLSEAYTYAKMQGKAPAGFDRHVMGALKPKVNWRAVLRRYVSQLIPSDYSFLKPSRKSPPNILLPGIVMAEHLEGLVGIDTSGSISDRELDQFLSEVKWMAKNFPSINFRLVSCDAEIQTEEQIRSRYDVDRFKPKGGGGTDFRPVFELAVKRRAKLVIYFTDGYGEFPEKEPPFPTIWVVTEQGAPESHFPFGKVIKIRC